MNIGVIFAGGVGRRMNSKDLPKQFIVVYGKPIIVHTLQVFDTHEDIDAIVVACVGDWIPHLEGLIEQYNIKKVAKVVPGGSCGQESIYNGLVAAKSLSDDNSVVLIHDGVRPFITHQLITDNIESVEKNGSAITTSKVTETILVVDETNRIDQVPDRERSRVAKAPQSFWIDDILAAHEQARKEGKMDFIDSCTMMQHYGHPLYLVDGDRDNIKVTTPEDIFTMRATLEAREMLTLQDIYK